MRSVRHRILNARHWHDHPRLCSFYLPHYHRNLQDLGTVGGIGSASYQSTVTSRDAVRTIDGLICLELCRRGDSNGYASGACRFHGNEDHLTTSDHSNCAALQGQPVSRNSSLAATSRSYHHDANWVDCSRYSFDHPFSFNILPGGLWKPRNSPRILSPRFQPRSHTLL